MTDEREWCTGGKQSAVDVHVAHTSDLGSKFSHMNGKRFGKCAVCGKSVRVVSAVYGTKWVAPRHKVAE